MWHLGMYLRSVRYVDTLDDIQSKVKLHFELLKVAQTLQADTQYRHILHQDYRCSMSAPFWLCIIALQYGWCKRYIVVDSSGFADQRTNSGYIITLVVV